MTLYILTNPEVTALTNLMNEVGTRALPYLPSNYSWVEYALEDAGACDFRKKAACLSGHFQHIRCIPTLEDLQAEICSCGYEGEYGGECVACFTGVREESGEAVTYTCRECGKDDVPVFKDCPCGAEPGLLSTESFLDALSAPEQDVYSIYILDAELDTPARFFGTDSEFIEFIGKYRDGCGSGLEFYLHHLGELKYHYCLFDEDDYSENGGEGYLHGVEVDGALYWYTTIDERECSIRFTNVREALLYLNSQLSAIYDEMERAHYADDYEVEGPFGGAFSSQEDYENWRFGGIDYLNSI